MNVPTAARAARASKTFDISDTSKGKHRPRAGIRRCDSTARATAGDVRRPQIGLPQGCKINILIIYVLGCKITVLIIYVL